MLVGLIGAMGSLPAQALRDDPISRMAREGVDQPGHGWREPAPVLVWIIVRPVDVPTFPRATRRVGPVHGRAEVRTGGLARRSGVRASPIGAHHFSTWPIQPVLVDDRHLAPARKVPCATGERRPTSADRELQ